MQQVFIRVRILFLTLFAVMTAGVFIYQYFWVAPQKRCEAAHNWWDSSSRQCGKVIYIPALTGRPVASAVKPAG